MDRQERPSIEQVLHSSTLLNALTPAQLEPLARSARIAEAHRGEYIWLDGSEVDFFGIIGSGFVKMVRSADDGVDVTLEIMGPGQIFGMLGTIEGSGCPLSAAAVTHLWYLRLPKSVFLPIYKESDALKDRLIRRSAVRLHAAKDLLARMSTGKIDERIAAILFLLADSYGEEQGKAIRLTIPLTRQEIAEMAGTTGESAIRTLSKWQKLGHVRTDHGYITILNRDAVGAFLRF